MTHPEGIDTARVENAQRALDAAVTEMLEATGWVRVDDILAASSYVVAVQQTGVRADGEAINRNPIIVGPEGRILPTLAIGMLELARNLIVARTLNEIHENEQENGE